GGEPSDVDPARHDLDRRPRDTHPAQLLDLLGTLGDDPVGEQAQLAFEAEPGFRAGVLVALEAALDRAERVVRDHHRDTVGRGRGQGRQAAHPEVRVHHIRHEVRYEVGGGPARRKPPPELTHERKKIIFWYWFGRADRHMLDTHAVIERD